MFQSLCSPEQIAGWLKRTYRDDETHQVSHETFVVVSSRLSQIATLVERHTRYVMLVKVAGTDTETVINSLIKNARKLPQELYKSMTSDRGKERAAHKRFTLATHIKFFSDSHSPWQRGTNENTNGLLRQFPLRGMSV
jgi:IS30 family transposase